VELPDFKTIHIPEYRLTKRDGDYIPFQNEPADVPPLANFGVGYRYHITGLFHDQQGFSTQRLDEIDPWLERVNTKLEKHLDDILMVETDFEPGARTAIISYGASARASRHALKLARARGLKVDQLTLLTIWPFPESQVETLGEQADRIIVPEMNLGQLAYEVERMVGRKKVKRVTRANGEMVTPQMILDAIESKP
jgi:2-oxoglutarate/2-oxoacid ferredoxin oxidoreductase subunit alpha